MKKSKNRGITLVALVVTIIILLILAGVVIGLLTQTGLFENAKQAKNSMENAQKNENLIIADYGDKINEIVESSSRENNQKQPNEENTMSGEEHFTGEYYFNGKPIYEKTIYISSLSSSAGTKDYQHGINDTDEIWFNTSKSFLKWKNIEGNPVSTIPYTKVVGDNTAKISLYNLKNKTFTIDVGADRSAVCAYVTINYTKTTDQSNGKTIPETLAN